MAFTRVRGPGITTDDNYRVGIITATKFVGPMQASGDSDFTNISATGIGTIDGVKIGDPSGIVTASSSSGIVTYYGDASKLTGLTAGQIPNLDGAKITSGTVAAARIDNLDGAKITSGTVAAARIDNLAASKITSGTVATARLGSGTANSSSFLRGDQSWAAVTSTTINSNTNNYLITGTGTADTLQGEANLTFDGDDLLIKSSTNGRRISFAGDGSSHYMKFDSTLNGIILNGYGGITFETNGTNERLRITSAGLVGIGTNNPTAKSTTSVTHSNGAVAEAVKITTTGSYSSSNSSNAGPAISFGQFHNVYPNWTTGQIVGIRRGTNWDGALAFYTNSGSSQTDISEKLLITSAGDMGLGCNNPGADPAIGNDATVFEIRQTTSGNITSGNNRKGAVLRLKHEAQWENGYQSSSPNDDLGRVEFVTGDNSTGEGVRSVIRCRNLQYFNAQALTFEVATANSASLEERLRIDSSGDVGIGTAVVLGDSKVHICDTSTSNYRPIAIDSAATNGSALIYRQLGTQVISIGSGGGNNLSGSSVTHGLIRSEVATVFAVGNNERVRITGNQLEKRGGGSYFAYNPNGYYAKQDNYDNNGGKSYWYDGGSGNNNIVASIDGQTGNIMSKGNIIIGTAGKGIDFSAQTPASATGQSVQSGGELLDHYECGNWTPILKNTSNTPTWYNQQGKYVRIGKMVHLWGFMQIGGTAAQFSNTSASAVFGGIPIAPGNGCGYTRSCGGAVTSQKMLFQGGNSTADGNLGGTYNDYGANGELNVDLGNGGDEFRFNVAGHNDYRGTLRNACFHNHSGWIFEFYCTYTLW